MNYLCSFYFLVELLLRMLAYGRGFFTRPESRGVCMLCLSRGLFLFI